MRGEAQQEDRITEEEDEQGRGDKSLVFYILGCPRLDSHDAFCSQQEGSLFLLASWAHMAAILTEWNSRTIDV